MSDLRPFWPRLKLELRLTLAAWLACKAQQLTPPDDKETHWAFHFLFLAMRCDDIGMERCRAWSSTTKEARR